MAISGLSRASRVDFHFRINSLYWSDSSQGAIMKSTLEGLKKNVVLNHGLSQPGKLMYTANGLKHFTVTTTGEFVFRKSLCRLDK